MKKVLLFILMFAFSLFFTFLRVKYPDVIAIILFVILINFVLYGAYLIFEDIFNL